MRFTEDDIDLFSKASGDRNPLHLDSEYAERTSYGMRVVFGALGALAALGHVMEAQRQRIRSINADFLRPMFLGVDYQVHVSPQFNGTLIRLLDGTLPVVSVAVTFGDQDPAEPVTERPVESVFEHQEALARQEANIVRGLAVNGRYRTADRACAELCRRWNVRAPRLLIDALLWSSYLVGMELPGKSALFFRFTAQIDGHVSRDGMFGYEARVESVDPRLGQARIAFQLSSGNVTIVTGECRAFMRPIAPATDPETIQTQLSASKAMEAKIALLIGSSRGLGAALAYALASQGATVLGASRSAWNADLRYDSLPGRLISIQGDAADSAWREGLRSKILVDHGRLDLLVCNAFPAIVPLMLQDNAVARLRNYVARAMELVLGPLCSFLDLLNQSSGSLVLISSVAVERPVKEWPHYVAAKRASEALAEVAALQYPRVGVLVVRSERLLTEMTNTPLGRRNALRPEYMAARIVGRLLEGIAPGATQFFHWCCEGPGLAATNSRETVKSGA